jgi:hypothetical protein
MRISLILNDALVANAKTIGATSKYARKVAVSSTMGAGIKVDRAEVAGRKLPKLMTSHKKGRE